jgi:hypothetical protein
MQTEVRKTSKALDPLEVRLERYLTAPDFHQLFVDLRTGPDGEPRLSSEVWGAIASEQSLYGRIALTRLHVMSLLEKGFSMDEVQQQIIDTKWEDGFSYMPLLDDPLGIGNTLYEKDFTSEVLNEARLCVFDLLYLADRGEPINLEEYGSQLATAFGEKLVSGWVAEYHDDSTYGDCMNQLFARNEVPSLEHLKELCLRKELKHVFKRADEIILEDPIDPNTGRYAELRRIEEARLDAEYRAEIPAAPAPALQLVMS